MSNMKNYELYTDECTKIFIDAMRDQLGQLIDLSAWLQWYAFDVIASISFQRRFGFMEQRKDVDHMIKSLDIALQYSKVGGQFPGIHPWLIGNKALLNALKRLGMGLPDALLVSDGEILYP